MEDLMSLSRSELAEKLEGLPAYRALQIFTNLHLGKRFAEMTSLPKELRAELALKYVDQPVVVEKRFDSKIDKTRKYLMRLTDGNLIECVYMVQNYGTTLCISTQVGCRMGCKFCASGLDGLKRNLTAGEMLGQIITVNRDEGGTIDTRAVTNVVLMGSGEPFDNYANVTKFFDILRDEKGINISERNISLSTSGLCDKIKKFAADGYKATLSISLHAPNDEVRSELMPVNNKYSISKVIEAAKYYFEKTGRRVIFEYSLIHGFNDTPQCAVELAGLVRSFPSHINLIRLNEVPENIYCPPSVKDTNAFLKRLTELGVSATLRKSAGADIEGACGMLRRRYSDGN